MKVSFGKAVIAGICSLGLMALTAAAADELITGNLTVEGSATIDYDLTASGGVILGPGALKQGETGFAWSDDNTIVIRTTNHQFVIYASDSIHLLGGPIFGNGSGLTGLNGANFAAGSIHGSKLESGTVGENQLGAQVIGNEHIAPDACINGSKLANGSIPIGKVTIAGWETWGDGRYMSLSGEPDLVLSSPGRIVAGNGLSLASIANNAYGASQQGRISSGSQTIGSASDGALQRGWNHAGTRTIGGNSYGASQVGQNSGTQVIGSFCLGARQEGLTRGTAVIGGFAFGAVQQGLVDTAAFATNNGVGSIQLLSITASQKALMNGSASLGLGACTVTNNQAIVAGDGLASHGNGTITAVGFYGSGAGLTDLVNGQVAWTGNHDAGGFTLSRLVEANSFKITDTTESIWVPDVIGVYVDDNDYGLPCVGAYYGNVADGFSNPNGCAILWDDSQSQWRMDVNCYCTESDYVASSYDIPSYAQWYCSYYGAYYWCEYTGGGFLVSGGTPFDGYYAGDVSSGFWNGTSVFTYDGEGTWYFTHSWIDSYYYNWLGGSSDTPPTGSGILDTSYGVTFSINLMYDESQGQWVETLVHVTNDIPYEIADGRKTWMGDHHAGGFNLDTVGTLSAIAVSATSLSGNGSELSHIGSNAIEDGSIAQADLNTASIDARYVTKSGNSTITGNLDVQGDLKINGQSITEFLGNLPPKEGDLDMGPFTDGPQPP